MRLAYALLATAAAIVAPPLSARPLTPAESAQNTRANAELSAAMNNRDWKAAAAALRTQLAINRAAYGPDDANTLTVLDTLATAEQLGGNYQVALDLFREEEAARRKRGETATAQYAYVLGSIGISLDRLGRYAEAEETLKRALALRAKTNGPESREYQFIQSELGKALANGGKLTEARDLAASTLDAVRKREGAEGDAVAPALGNLASAEVAVGNYDRANALYQEALALQRKKAGPASMPVAIVLGNIGFLESKRGNYKQAEAMLRQALAIQRKLPDQQVALPFSLGNLASVVQNGGRPADSLPLYREAIAGMQQTLGPDHPNTVRIEGNYASALTDLGRLAEAEPILKRVYERRRADLGPAHPETVIATNNLASITEKLGREQEAEALYREAIAAARAGNVERPDLASAIANLAANLGEQGRFDEAIELHGQALAMREKLLGANHPDVAISLSNLGFIRTQQGQPTDAQPLLARAVAINRTSGAGDLTLATSLNNLGANLVDLNRLDEADKAYREAYAIRLKALGPDHPQVAVMLNNLGYSATTRGRAAEAAGHYRRAIAIYRKSARRDDPDLIAPLDNLALTVVETPKGSAEAIALSDEAADIARKRRALLLSGGTGDAATKAASRARGERALGADPFVTAFMGVAEVSWKAGAKDPALRDKAFAAAQEVDLSSAAQAMARTAARAAAGGGPLGALVARQQAVSARLVQDEAEYLAAVSQGDAARGNAVDVRIRKGGAELAEIDARIDREFPSYRALIAPTPLAAEDVANRLAPDEGLLFIVPLNGSMYSFAVGPGGRQWARLDKGQKGVSARVTKLLCQLDPVTCEAGADSDQPLSKAEREGYRAFDRETGFSLYRDLVAPVESALAGAKRVYTVSIGKIGAAPLGLLPTEAPAPGSDDADPDVLKATPWLADRYAIVALPSVASLRFADSARAEAKGAFIGYGAPRLGGRQGVAAKRGVFKGRDVADQTLLASLAPLPGTETELKAMAAALGSGASSLRLATAATETALKKDARIRDAKVIAFATHGLLPGELSGFEEPGLVFTPPGKPSLEDDGVLAASEASALALNADWVILSACNTAAGERGADGLSGLARAFLFAGARSLLASHWRVSDDATAALTVEALANDKTMTRSLALQAAMRAIRTGKRADGSALPGWKAEWAHPAYWAPFSLIANGDR